MADDEFDTMTNSDRDALNHAELASTGSDVDEDQKPDVEVHELFLDCVSEHFAMVEYVHTDKRAVVPGMVKHPRWWRDCGRSGRHASKPTRTPPTTSTPTPIGGCPSGTGMRRSCSIPSKDRSGSATGSSDTYTSRPARRHSLFRSSNPRKTGLHPGETIGLWP